MRRVLPVISDMAVPAQVRARRLLAWLEDIGRFGGGEAMLSYAWARLAGLLDAAAAGDPGARAAVGAVRQHDAGCAAWWDAVRAAWHACESGAAPAARGAGSRSRSRVPAYREHGDQRHRKAS